ncbi:hypothetical protein MATL_G00192150 [Megalops atlanticus]|uniref:Uncharacterized protein n=1 Tax=Megalops atlanticus TaxID=7932 RepID=A0A9D3SYC4_MEGAT|nr:hypothetical protein MATL_G00192150 [Megalops atlanticus]
MVMKAKSLAILTVLWTITNIHLMNVLCEGGWNGSKVTFNGTDNIAKGERSVFPQYLVISAVLGGTLILLFIALSAGLRKSIQGRCQDKHVYTNTSEGYLDKFKSTCACPLDMPDSQSKDNNQNTVEMIDEKNKTDVTEDDLSTDDDGKRAFHVNRNDIVEARRKLRGKRGNFFKGDTRTNTETDGFFKRKKSLHLYINSQELKKQIQKAPEAISAQTKGTKKQGESQRRLQRAREQQLRSDDIYANT